MNKEEELNIENIDNNFIWYCAMTRGGLDKLTRDQKREIFDVAQLAWDFDRIRKWIKE